jgi:phosphatidylserine decarboxylase
MRPPYGIHYYDRYTAQVKQEKVFGASFLNWSYNTSFGRILTQMVFSRRTVSLLIGWLCRRSFSRHFISPFAKWSQLDSNELPCHWHEFRSFSEFFTREMAPGQRKIAGDDSVCIAPVDGKIYVLPELKMDEYLRVKRCLFNLSGLLNDRVTAQKFDGGMAVIFRLCLSDYHRIHFPVSGVPDLPVAINGRCYAGGPYDKTSYVPFYSENVRMVTKIKSDGFGDVAMVEIGAFTIASIVQKYQPGQYVRRGEEKGWFEPGGSTVVLVFQKGAINVDTELQEYTRRGMETRVRFGDSIGRVAAGERKEL